MNRFSRLANVWEQQLPDGDSELVEFENAFYQKFKEAALRAGRILEIGAGKGRMVRVLKRTGVKAEIHCVDLNAYVQQSSPYAVMANAINLPYRSDSFDLSYSLGVIEHFPETALAIREHIRVVRPGGHILITTPHLSPYTLLRFLVWLIKFRKKGSFEQTIGRNLTLSYLSRELRRAGGELLAGGATGFVLPGPLKNFAWVVKKVVPERYFGAYVWVLARKI